MNAIKSSLICKAINKLDINDLKFSNLVQESFFIKALNNFFEKTQNLFFPLFGNSLFIKNIDKIIMLILSMIIVAIPVTSTGIIGGLIALSFMVLVFKLFFVKGTKLSFSSFDLPVFLYIAIAGISVTFSSQLIPSIKGYIKMIIYFGGFLTYFNIMKNNPKRILYIIGLIALTASIEAVNAIYQQIVGVEALASWQDSNEVNPEQLMNRVYGTLKPYNPNLLAGYLVSTFPFSLGISFLLLYKKKIGFSIASFVGNLAIILGIIFTGSRGAYIALSAMLSIFTVISGRFIFNDLKEIKWLKKIWVFCIISGLLLTFIVIVTSPALQHRIDSIFILRGDSSNSYRFNVYASTLKMFIDNFFIGIGPGNTTFRLMYGLYMVTGYDALGAYNIFLEIAAESGIFALLAFLWLILTGFLKCTKKILSNICFDRKIIISACIISLAGMMAHGFFDTVWYRPQVNTIFWLLIAIIAVVSSEKYSKEEK